MKICSELDVGKETLSPKCSLKAGLISNACRVEFI
jgi:hypothetical protein